MIPVCGVDGSCHDYRYLACQYTYPGVSAAFNELTSPFALAKNANTCPCHARGVQLAAALRQGSITMHHMQHHHAALTQIFSELGIE
jgi:hypothetical protein